jgi:RNA polymerase sigma-70 factor, ECF subfamily
MLDFNKIHDEYYGKVLSHLRGIIGEHAEDCAQEIFIKIHKNISKLKDETKLSSWIYSITLNTAKDALRASKSGASCISLDKTEKTTSTESTPLQDRVPDTREKTHEDVIAKKEMSQCYIDFVKKLPKNYYEIYALSEFEKLSDTEIADKLSISIETVKVRMHRARTKLYEELRKNCSCYCDSSGDLTCEPKK